MKAALSRVRRLSALTVTSALLGRLGLEYAIEALELLGAELTVGQRGRCATYSLIGGVRDCCRAHHHGLTAGSNHPGPRFARTHEAGETCPEICPELGNSDLN
jgi:hypothetical protein